MPTIVTSVIAESGGDYTTVTAWEAAAPANLVTDDKIWKGRLNRNTVESPVFSGKTTDAGHYSHLTSYTREGIGRTGLLAHKDVIYGSLTITDESAVVEDIGFPRGSSGAILHTGTTQNTVTIRRVWCQSVTSTGVGLRSTNSHASTVVNAESCVVFNCIGSGINALSGFGGTFNTKNCLVFDLANVGISRAAGTHNIQNNYSLANTTDYTGTFGTNTTNASGDGSASTTQVTAAQWARCVSRLATLKFYWTGEHEPAAAPGKIDRSVYYRRHGDGLGALGGNAAISAGSLTGTTGGLAFPERLMSDVDNLAGAVRATIAPSQATVGLQSIKASGDDFNRVGFWISAGKLTLSLWDNAGALVTAVQHTPSGDAYAGTHTFGWRVSGGTAYLYVDDMTTPVASAAYSGTRDATDTLATTLGWISGATYLGAGNSLSAADTATGSAAPPALPMELYADGTGALDVLALSPLSSATLKNGGTAAGAPTIGADGLPLADRRRFDETAGHSIGAFGYHPTATPGGDLWGPGLISGDVVVLPGPVYP